MDNKYITQLTDNKYTMHTNDNTWRRLRYRSTDEQFELEMWKDAFVHVLTEHYKIWIKEHLKPNNDQP